MFPCDDVIMLPTQTFFRRIIRAIWSASQSRQCGDYWRRGSWMVPVHLQPIWRPEGGLASGPCIAKSSATTLLNIYGAPVHTLHDITVTSHERHGVSQHREFHCLFNSLFRLKKKANRESLSDRAKNTFPCPDLTIRTNFNHLHPASGNYFTDTWVRILASPEEGNLSPFDSKIPCLFQTIKINNNKHI